MFQAIVAKLNSLIDRNLGFRLYRRMLVQENKWRAVRYGLDGKMIDFGKETEVPVRDLVLELLEFVDDVVDDLGSRKEIEHVHTILARGTSADRQLQVYRETNDLKAVVDDLIKMTMENVPESVPHQRARSDDDCFDDREVGHGLDGVCTDFSSEIILPEHARSDSAMRPPRVPRSLPTLPVKVFA